MGRVGPSVAAEVREASLLVTIRAATAPAPLGKQCIDGFALSSMIRAGSRDKWNCASLPQRAVLRGVMALCLAEFDLLVRDGAEMT